MSCCSSSSRKGMHGGGSEEFWREYIGGTSLQLFEVIYQAIQLAKIDYPDRFLAERDFIAQNLFSSHLLNKKHSKEEEEEEEIVVSNCSSKKATIATGTTTTEEPAPTSLSKGGRGGVGAVAVDRVNERSGQSLHRPPTVTIRCQVRTTTDDHKGPTNTMRGIQEKHPIRPSLLKPAKSINHQTPTGGPANNDRDLLDKKVEASKRKLREAYDEEDRTKRLRRTQLLDSSQSAKLMHRNNLPTTHQLTNKANRNRNNNNTNTWATRRR